MHEPLAITHCNIVAIVGEAAGKAAACTRVTVEIGKLSGVMADVRTRSASISSQRGTFTRRSRELRYPRNRRPRALPGSVGERICRRELFAPLPLRPREADATCRARNSISRRWEHRGGGVMCGHCGCSSTMRAEPDHTHADGTHHNHHHHNGGQSDIRTTIIMTDGHEPSSRAQRSARSCHGHARSTSSNWKPASLPRTTRSRRATAPGSPDEKYWR